MLDAEVVAVRLRESLVHAFTDAIVHATSMEDALRNIALRTIDIIEQLLIELAIREAIAAITGSTDTGGVGSTSSSIFSIIGTAVGAYFGGPAGAAAGSSIGCSIGGGRAAMGAAFDAGERLRRYA